ncbi:pyridoxal phosphate-dependent aminotransferase [Altererythrobacter sp. MF3-039]|uniref:pyridoxal phosphate-dependent aminotransferase n=1 Tax=Altererythrobacter sp. MF3-039 TaxID=3252901 RepID=UPI00390C572C
MISPALSRVEISQTSAITDRAAQLRAEGRDVISLSVGEPDFDTPAHVIEAAKRALDEGQTRYTPVAGTPALREAAALHFKRDLGIATEPGNVIVTSGGKQAIFEALLGTISPGDEVIIPAPWWVSYPQIVRFAGGTVVPLKTVPEDGYLPDPARLESLITAKTRWLLLNTPCNPTGAVYPPNLMLDIAAIVERHPRVLVLSDDIYWPLIYGRDGHHSLAALAPEIADQVLTVSGVSKSHAMTGFRLGLATGPAELIAAMNRLQSHNSGNASSISQAAAVAALTGPQEFLTAWRERFRSRRDEVVKAINAVPGLSTPTPQGAFYCFVDASPLMEQFGDDTQLTLHLLDAGVAVVPASAFGGKHGFRISFAASDEQLTEANSRIAKALA